MTYAAQHKAIRERFFLEFNGTAPVAWPNVDFSPPNSGLWVRISILDTDSRWASFGSPGSNVKRNTGSVYISVFSPLGKGDGPALILCDDIISIFNGWSHSSGIKFRFLPFIQQVPIFKDRWIQLNVICPFERDSFG